MRITRLFFTALMILGFSLCFLSDTGARSLYDSVDPEKGGPMLKPTSTAIDNPNTQFDVHNIGKISMIINNYGTFGFGYVTNNVIDGEVVLGCEYPANSNLEYLYAGALWIGAVVGRDTLVSVGGDGWYGTQELFPDAGDNGAIIARSNLKSKSYWHPDAISEQDFLCTFTDTFVSPGLTGQDPIENRNHIPLNISVQQNSYAWSYDYAEDFVLLDYKITNIGAFPIRDLYMGVYVDADVYHTSIENTGYQDDICGFRRTVPMPEEFCMEDDTVNIAWIADNDGDPNSTGGPPGWAFTSPRAVTGTRVVRSPNDSLVSNFNWWISHQDASRDFGPRKASTPEDPFYEFPLGPLGTPTGDKSKYYVMSHPEFDYDQLFTAVPHTDEGYLPPPSQSLALDFANGYDTRYLLSFGPFDVQPGDTLPITLAYMAGDDFHIGPSDFEDNEDYISTEPNIYYDLLNFDDFGLNARWASWIFDNPGVDTDNDGDSGRFNWSCQVGSDVLCFPECETPDDSILQYCEKIYYRGDYSTSDCYQGTGEGAPDFVGASPPPPPDLTVIPGYGEVTIRWNGQRSENAYDVFSRQKDFEGYRVYYAEGDRLSDYVALTSYDVNDYKVLQFNDILLFWEQTSVPLTLDSLHSLYGPDFDPEAYDSEFGAFTDPLTGRRIYFLPQDWNESDLSNPNLIHRVYPEASRDDSSDTTDEGLMRYYEYEYVIENLQPSKPYNFSVTAFDYGSLKVDLGALESSPLVNAVKEYPLPSADKVEEEGLGVIVFPNPYRIDGGYAEAGYENRERKYSAERSREIHFANLPRICRIRIYSINGDLIREIDHYRPEGGPESQHEVWDVISRNTQAVVTGIYMWHVESEMGEQLGKLVIMK
ncbi:MAG: hypothetical protein GY841_08185 [FCB group bacterium]|nr:hypothetical protein [FCB group bacterium]